jgi:N-acetylglucosamine malate deacetylase 2
MAISSELLGRTLILVAHPDDETFGCGALIQCMSEPIVVFATDGAPWDTYFWEKHGSRLRYARLRQEEARTALALAGVNEIVFLAEEAEGKELFVDQDLFHCIPEAVARLTAIVTRYRPSALLTSAYEGGHPDHDVCSFLSFLLGRERRLPVWEFPLYHRTDANGGVFQQFAETGPSETVLEITSEESKTKREMLAAYPSQGSFSLNFDLAKERFRPQYAYDYSQPPQVGAINYETWQWPMTAVQVCKAMSDFLESADVAKQGS